MPESKVLKITESAYFVVEIEDYTKTIVAYDPYTSRQTITVGGTPESEETEADEEMEEELETDQS